MAKFNVAVMGAGDRGTVHANTWNDFEDADVKIICDKDKERAKKLAKGVNASPCFDWEEAIQTDDINVVSIALPTVFHSPITCAAAENGQHVFCEKPMALNQEHGEKMLEAVKSNGVVFVPSFQYRYTPAPIKYRELFQKGQFGGPVTFRFTDIREVRPKTAMHSQSINGGVVIDMTCHHLDLLRYITGEEPVSVYASGHIFGKGKERLKNIDDFAIDETTMEVTMDGGSQLQLYVNWGMPENFAFPDNGEVIIGPEMAARPCDPDEGDVELIYGNHKDVWFGGRNEGEAALIRELTGAVREDRQPNPNIEDAFATLRVSLAALKSIETGEVVKL